MDDTRTRMNMNAYRQRDGLFPIFVDHFKGTFEFLHLIVVHVWLEHFCN
jgi:hypothetical protein